MRLDVQLLGSMRVLHCNKHLRVEIRDLTAAAEFNPLHGEDDAQLPPQDKADVAVGIADGANDGEPAVGAGIHDADEIFEND